MPATAAALFIFELIIIYASVRKWSKQEVNWRVFYLGV